MRCLVLRCLALYGHRHARSLNMEIVKIFILKHADMERVLINNINFAEEHFESVKLNVGPELVEQLDIVLRTLELLLEHSWSYSPMAAGGGAVSSMGRMEERVGWSEENLKTIDYVVDMSPISSPEKLTVSPDHRAEGGPGTEGGIGGIGGIGGGGCIGPGKELGLDTPDPRKGQKTRRRSWGPTQSTPDCSFESPRAEGATAAARALAEDDCSNAVIEFTNGENSPMTPVVAAAGKHSGEQQTYSERKSPTPPPASGSGHGTSLSPIASPMVSPRGSGSGSDRK